MNNNLKRFIEAQSKEYNHALTEIKNGKKISHWMWYIFSEILGLGFTETAIFYELKNIDEGYDFLNNEELARRLFEITKVLSDLNKSNVIKICGYPDDKKLKYSMTLFYIASNHNEIFNSIIDKYFNGVFCESTIQLLNIKQCNTIQNMI